MLSPPGQCTRMPQYPVKMGILRSEVEALLQKKEIKEATSSIQREGVSAAFSWYKRDQEV